MFQGDIYRPSLRDCARLTLKQSCRIVCSEEISITPMNRETKKVDSPNRAKMETKDENGSNQPFQWLCHAPSAESRFVFGIVPLSKVVNLKNS